MTSSSQGQPAPRTGAHRAHGRAPRGADQVPPARHEPYLDGLFTYCLSVLCDHDAATDVLADVLAVAERQAGRSPQDPSGHRAWLYALARWSCLRHLAARRRPGAHTTRRAPEHARVHTADAASGSAPEGGLPDVDAIRRDELARLAWPEAAGTTPEQREALELAVRHHLAVSEVAAVLGTAPAAARELLAAAACEVERTRAALAVVETGTCPQVSRLTGDSRVLLSAALRAELVRHVDDCPRCRRAAERVGLGSPWPGSGGIGAVTLPLVTAPRSAVHLARVRVPKARSGGPRFDRTGFPVDPRDRAARRERLRARAVTTTVVATVVAAPVLALWAAYRGGPATGEGAPGAIRVSASDEDRQTRAAGGPYEAYENAGNARSGSNGRFVAGGRHRDVHVEVISTGAPAEPAPPGAEVPGRLTVGAVSEGGTTVVTLTVTGGSPVAWQLWSDAPWLWASRSSGVLEPGETFIVRITVDPRGEPAGYWTARIGIDPAGAVISVEGRGKTPPDPPGPTLPTPTPTPTPSPTASPTPTPTPTPTPDPTSSPSDPPPPTPTPTDPTQPPE
ncbi:sigma-70 family RNA polymerase sigma factor [Streptomyces bambusae]|uniref:RNA polymerase sigma factor n=1 Tax=Streptomyces bambusae TaxID=1550616 RepID=UPI001CFFDAFC|nr:sigma-70 family RNA polymerase sigma factor [Streptomyces bambusae]MCB5170308.1 sigma-70 family RNA polymerase sigma factor [Streptomyces bambusae]